MRVELHPCFILHTRPFRESSVILELFSREHGRCAVVAKGVRSRKSRFRSLMQPFTNLNMAWTGRGELGTLTDVELLERSPRLNAPQMISAYYVNELLLRLLHTHEPHPELFERYRNSISSLGEKDQGEKSQAGLRIFEKHLLHSIGYGLILDHDVATGAPVERDGLYTYRPDSGPTRQHGAPDDKASPPGLTIPGRALLQLDRDDIRDPEALAAIKKLMKHVLERRLDNRPLKSRRLYREYLDNIQAD